MTGNARIPQLRVIVNSRCGRACFFCRPSGEAIATRANVALDPDLLVKVAAAYTSLGGEEVKLTGGEPALWEPIIEGVRRLKSQALVPQVHVISRHPRIGDLAANLAESGLDLFNLSIDTLRPELHHLITGVDDLPAVISAVELCVATGKPTKVNTVVMAGVNDDEVNSIITFCEQVGVHSLKLMDVIKDLDKGSESYARRLVDIRGHGLRGLHRPLASIAESLRARSVRSRWVSQGGLGHPLLVLELASGLEVIIKDNRNGAWYGSICVSCHHYPCHDALMALRVTADARLQFCLLREDITIDLAQRVSDNGSALKKVVADALTVYQSAEFTLGEAAVQ